MKTLQLFLVVCVLTTALSSTTQAQVVGATGKGNANPVSGPVGLLGGAGMGVIAMPALMPKPNPNAKKCAALLSDMNKLGDQIIALRDPVAKLRAEIARLQKQITDNAAQTHPNTSISVQAPKQLAAAEAALKPLVTKLENAQAKYNADQDERTSLGC